MCNTGIIFELIKKDSIALSYLEIYIDTTSAVDPSN